jgi:EAL domain-containing protein (putative c-di-GMP-specific phosphodiesterase class I)
MPCSGIRFLLVEDHEFQRGLLAGLLRRLGAAIVHEAADGRGALQLLSDPDCPVDLVISDVCMPGMDGMEFMRHLSELAPGLPMVVASALEPQVLASVVHVAQAYKVRLLGVLAKPATAAKLTPMLDTFRRIAADVPDPGAAFSFVEIADAWTHEEFQPLYEPRVGLESGAVCSMHAVPSWQHPVRGTLAAAQFMPSIRARGLTDDFTWLMLPKAFAQCAEWRRRGLKVQVSVTLDLQSLAGGHLADEIAQLAVQQELEPEAVVLHIREQEFVSIRPGMLENLTRLRIMGFGLGVDDFGSGNFDVDRLALLPLTELKIHRDFVTNAARDKSAEAGLATCLDAAQQRRIRTIGDGMSSKEEWKMLHDWGCLMAQGPFVSTAIPGSSVRPWARRWSAARGR